MRLDPLSYERFSFLTNGATLDISAHLFLFFLSDLSVLLVICLSQKLR
jgi:hypothetical protein